ncbi:MAG: pilus assembly protein PilB, partial [Trichlorobacter sp.]|nr:pilus assembly protein PilB [Trichlorobacter sp.]
MPEFKLGELLIQNKLISKEQFDQALEMQQLTPQQPIGQILCMLGFLNAKDLEYILDHNKKRRKLGDILVSQGLIDEEKLYNALSVSGEEKIPLGRALIRQHVIEEEQ